MWLSALTLQFHLPSRILPTDSPLLLTTLSPTRRLGPLQMQTGFAMLEVGNVHYKNTRNILIKVEGPSSSQTNPTPAFLSTLSQ